MYCKILKKIRHPKYCCNYHEIWTMCFDHRIMLPIDAVGMANSVDPDLIWVYTVCSDLPCWKFRMITVVYNLSLVTRKPVFGVCDQVSLKPSCSATETRYMLEIFDLETRGIILSRQRITKVLIRLRGCAGWSAPLLFTYGRNRFSHVMSHFIHPVSNICSQQNLLLTQQWFDIYVSFKLIVVQHNLQKSLNRGP